MKSEGFLLIFGLYLFIIFEDHNFLLCFDNILLK